MLTKNKKIVLGATLILFLFIVIISSWTIPFAFESSTMYYKFGVHKVLLRAGKIFGLTAFVLAWLQIILISRFRLLDRVFSHNQLVNFHGINGLILLGCAISHPLLVMAAENFTLYPLEKRYWPEFLGMGFLSIILMVVLVSFWRRKFCFSYEQWLRLHRMGTLIILCGLFIHIIFVSDAFGDGLPRYIVLGAQGLFFWLLARLWFRRVLKPHRVFAVSKIHSVGRKSQCLEIVPTDGRVFDFAPGQFAFITPISKNISRQEHPFTIASSPTHSGSLQFVIKAIGDWTRRINLLAKGDPVYLDGPLGQFSYLSLSDDQPVIMIAGGIGITPMLSMLRFMADNDDQREILLIWSNRTPEDIFFKDEFDELKHRLNHLAIKYIITSKQSDEQIGHRLDKEMLEELTNHYPKTANLFICGPPGMMKQIRKDVIQVGFSSTRVYTEKFRL